MGEFGAPVVKKDDTSSQSWQGDRFYGLNMWEGNLRDSMAATMYASSAEFSSRNTDVWQWSGLNPAQFGYMRRAYDKGDFKNCIPVFEKIMNIDDRLLAVSQKRYESVACLDYEIQLMDGVKENDADAKAQQAVVRDFFNTLEFSSIMQRDMTQGLSSLIAHLMTAICYGYAAAIMCLRPAKTETGMVTVHGRAISVPLRFFEAKNRALALRLAYEDEVGVPLNPAHWIVCANPNAPLVLSSVAMYILKSTPLEDWAHVVEKFGQPFIYARSSSARNSQEWRELGAVISKLGSDFSGVFGKDVEISAQSIAQGSAPHQALIEHIDTAMSVLWRGGDLSTQGVAMWGQSSSGVSLQQVERNAIVKADRLMIEEAIDFQITKKIINAVFGPVRQKVYFKFATDDSAETSTAMQKLNVASSIGLPISKKWAYMALNMAQPAEGDDTITIKPKAENEPTD
ncbi:MAG: DUF935 domain-containing protein [Bacteroidales bacterium]|nr:DUF935 domain-containing protein [Bacteroidales bacterium]